MSAGGLVGCRGHPCPPSLSSRSGGCDGPVVPIHSGCRGAARGCWLCHGVSWCLCVCLSVSTTSPFSFLPVCLSPKELSLNPWRRSKYGEATLDEGHGLGGIFFPWPTPAPLRGNPLGNPLGNPSLLLLPAFPAASSRLSIPHRLLPQGGGRLGEVVPVAGQDQIQAISTCGGQILLLPRSLWRSEGIKSPQHQCCCPNSMFPLPFPR